MVDAKEFYIVVDSKPDFKFEGVLIATVSSPEKGGRWTELSLYKTASNYVCHRQGHSKWEGEKTRSQAAVAITLDDVVGFFGQRRLSKELYRVAGIDNFEVIE